MSTGALTRKILIAIFITTIAIRCYLYFFRTYPLGMDECMLAVNLRDGTLGQLFKTLPFYDILGPIGFLLSAKIISAPFHYVPWSLRLLPFAASLAGILIVFFTRLLSNLEKLIVLSLFTVSPLVLEYSAEVKQYGTDFFFSLVFALAAYGLARNPGPVRARWMYLVAGCIAAVFVVGFPILLAAVLVALSFQVERRQFWRIAGLSLLPGMLFSVYYLAVFRPAGVVNFSNYAIVFNEFSPPYHRALALINWFRVLELRIDGVADLDWPSTLKPFAWAFFPVFGILPVAYCAIASKGKDFFATLWAAAAAAITLLALLRLVPASQDRYFLFFYPLVCLGFASACVRLFARGYMRAAPALAMALLAVPAFRFLARPPEDATRLLEYLQHHDEAAMPYVVTNSAQPFMDYYFPLLGRGCISAGALRHGYVNRCSAVRPSFAAAAANPESSFALPGAWALQIWVIDDQKRNQKPYFHDYLASNFEQQYDAYLHRVFAAEGENADLVFQHSTRWYFDHRMQDLGARLPWHDLLADSQNSLFVPRLETLEPNPR